MQKLCCIKHCIVVIVKFITITSSALPYCHSTDVYFFSDILKFKKVGNAAETMKNALTCAYTVTNFGVSLGK